MPLLTKALNDQADSFDALMAISDATADADRLVAADHETALPLAGFINSGSFWAHDENTNALSITTGQVRTMVGVFKLSSKPQNVVIESIAGTGIDVLTYEFRTQDIASGDDFPGSPDISAQSQGTGLRDTDTISLSGLSFPGGEGVLLRIDVTTKGNTNIFHSVFKIHWEY